MKGNIKTKILSAESMSKLKNRPILELFKLFRTTKNCQNFLLIENTKNRGPNSELLFGVY